MPKVGALRFGKNSSHEPRQRAQWHVAIMSCEDSSQSRDIADIGADTKRIRERTWWH